jgi:hypothetical protein
MKRPDFGDYSKRRKWFIQVLSFFCSQGEFKFPPKFLGYFTGHIWETVVILRKHIASPGYPSVV